MIIPLLIFYLSYFFINSKCDAAFDKEARNVDKKIIFKISGYRNQKSKGTNKGCCGISQNQACLPCNFRFELVSEGFESRSISSTLIKRTVLGTSSRASEELFENYENSIIFSSKVYDKHSIEVSSMQYTSAVQDTFIIINSYALSNYIYRGTFGQNNFIELWAELYLEQISDTKDFFTAFLRVDTIQWLNFKTIKNECCYPNQDDKCKIHCDYQIRWNIKDDYLDQAEISPINDERKVNVSATIVSASRRLKTAKLSYNIEIYSPQKRQQIDTYSIPIVNDIPNIEYKANNAKGAYNNVILNISWMHNCPLSKGINCNKKCDSDGIITSCDPVTGKLFCLNGAQDTPKCEQFLTDCKINPCKNNGICFEKSGIVQCACKPGYFGKLCQLWKCDNDCNGNGKCVGPNICNCIPPFIGENCEGSPCKNDANKKCGLNGECLIIEGKETCICKNPLFTGENCSEPICNPECVFGHCRYANNLQITKCICNEPYEGLACNIVKESLSQNLFSPRYAGSIIAITLLLIILLVFFGLMFFKIIPFFNFESYAIHKGLVNQ